jgi:hypothetical protein
MYLFHMIYRIRQDCRIILKNLVHPVSLSGYADAPRQQRLAHVIRMCQIQNRITQQDQQLFVLASEQSSQRLLTGFRHDAFSHPLPKLSLRCPELLPVAANHERRLLFASLLFVHIHCRYTCVLA